MRKALSLLLTALLLPMLTSCTARAEQHTGEADGYGGPLKVRVTMNGNDVTKVEITEHSETPGVGSRAIDALPAAIEAADSIDVDSISGATVTSQAIKQAVSQAMGLTGVMQQVIPMEGTNTAPAQPVQRLLGVGMASTGRVGPGKDADGNPVYSFNVVFAAGEFEENGVIRSMQVDQLEVVTPNLGNGSAFSGFPGSVGEEDAFMKEVSAWQTKGAMGDKYRLTSGTWREQMDEYQRLMEGKTVEEVKEWANARNNAAVQNGEAAATAQPDANTTATMSLKSEYGDILLAIERAWEDARKDKPGHENTMVDTNTVTDATDATDNLG